MNKKYVEEGVKRFVVEPVKYLSPNKSNIMFGFVVKNVDMHNNSEKINQIQNKTLNNKVVAEFSLVKNFGNSHHVYGSAYSLENKNLVLKHVFYNFAEIVNLTV